MELVNYDPAKLSEFLWNEYCRTEGRSIEYENDIRNCLKSASKALLSILERSDGFEKSLLIQIGGSVDDTNLELKKMSDYLKENFDKQEYNQDKLFNLVQTLLGNATEEKNKKRKNRAMEYADKWNENMFLNNFSKYDENAGVNVRLSDVYLENLLPHFIFQQNKSVSDDLKELLSEHLCEITENKMLLVLGQPGIGKSTLITWILANLQISMDDVLVYKFASDLKKVEWKKQNITENLCNELGLPFDELNGKILILDGYDEISVETDRKEILDQLYYDLVREKTLSRFSIIVTCRENYIAGIEKIRCPYITLQPWNKEQIELFCRVFHERANTAISERTMENILRNKEVLGIPLILYMVSALGMSLERKASIADVYDRIFSLDNGIYDRCIGRDNYETLHRISGIKEKIHRISEEIALWMFENDPDEACIPYSEYLKICEKAAQEPDPGKEEEKRDFLIGNYFRLVRHCEGVGAEKLYLSIVPYMNILLRNPLSHPWKMPRKYPRKKLPAL